MAHSESPHGSERFTKELKCTVMRKRTFAQAKGHVRIGSGTFSFLNNSGDNRYAPEWEIPIVADAGRPTRGNLLFDIQIQIIRCLHRESCGVVIYEQHMVLKLALYMEQERFMLEPERIEPFLQTQKAQGEASKPYLWRDRSTWS